MTAYTTLGLYVTPELEEELQDWFYETAGVVDITSYFEEPKSTVPDGDPLADAFAPVFTRIIEEFSGLYKSATFPVGCDPDEYRILTVAVPKNRVYAFKDRVEAVKLLEDTDVREVHTAILQQAVAQEIFSPT